MHNGDRALMMLRALAAKESEWGHKELEAYLRRQLEEATDDAARRVRREVYQVARTSFEKMTDLTGDWD